ncbi:hypothetical protein HN371_19385 [Candidatus Poribacteria bacterium]|jgi:hypothetical protein|nr:hypothetical protein [Candidatus Poribacteria bacterium]MBT5712740.1 hypothetical protein [Candidatus Poribacteria bacterium]MBT7096057.1 hypothetical protein [Candidatus Poribacteria bacterium]MBT7804351.1 hypothetical protein [Candidatus Poribacteria bacterium]
MRVRTFGRWTAAAVAVSLAITIAGAQEENLVTNADFEDELLDPWGNYGPITVELADKADAHTGTEAMKITVAAAGVNFWDAGVQFSDNIFFAKNTDYTWAMFFKSDPPVRVNIKPELGADPWTAYGENQVQLTEEYQEFWTEWNVGGSDVVPASLTLHVQFDAATIWMDDVRWYEGDYEPFEGGAPQSVDPIGKATTTWGRLKSPEHD